MRYHKKFETDSIWSVLKPMSVVGNPVTSVRSVGRSDRRSVANCSERLMVIGLV